MHAFLLIAGDPSSSSPRTTLVEDGRQFLHEGYVPPKEKVTCSEVLVFAFSSSKIEGTLLVFKGHLPA
jgi:hypothetical protein